MISEHEALGELIAACDEAAAYLDNIIPNATLIRARQAHAASRQPQPPLDGWVMVQAVRKAAATFREYEKMHADKGSLDGDVKARKNAALAEEMEAALAAPVPPAGGGSSGWRSDMENAPRDGTWVALANTEFVAPHCQWANLGWEDCHWGWAWLGSDFEPLWWRLSARPDQFPPHTRPVSFDDHFPASPEQAKDGEGG